MTTEPEIHIGRNIKRLREMLGIKQEALALNLGEEWNQKKVSRLEEREAVEDDILKQIADALHVTPEAIKNFDEEKAVNIISNTFHEHAFIYSSGTFNINPIDKLIKLHEEKIALYERMLKEKDEMMARMEKLLNK